MLDSQNFGMIFKIENIRVVEKKTTNGHLKAAEGHIKPIFGGSVLNPPLQVVSSTFREKEALIFVPMRFLNCSCQVLTPSNP